MKNAFLFICFFICSSFFVHAQTKQRELKNVLSLQMPDDPGARAASVAWHPKSERYYAPKSGNADYLMAIFDTDGNLVSPANIKTQFDIRGFWYSRKLKTFCANGYNDQGWVSYILDKNGYPSGTIPLVETMAQPDPQSVGSYNNKKNLVYFLDGSNVIVYNAANQKQTGTIRLFINQTSKPSEDKEKNSRPENINNSVVLYTGIKNAEFGLLDFINREIQLYNKKTGLITKKFSLPFDAPVNETLCFSYCNKIFWLFDMKTKTWKGYK